MNCLFVYHTLVGVGLINISELRNHKKSFYAFLGVTTIILIHGHVEVNCDILAAFYCKRLYILAFQIHNKFSVDFYSF